MGFAYARKDNTCKHLRNRYFITNYCTTGRLFAQIGVQLQVVAEIRFCIEG